MLVLTRREGESIVIDTTQGRVTITFVRKQYGQAVLSFDAPRSIKIDRAEIHEAKHQGEAHDGK